MKKIIACLVLLALLIIIACNTGKQQHLLSKPDDIVADEYVINIDKDTTLQTKNGALLKIPKGSLATDNGNTVVLEIKEAYSMEQIILAGLTTQSNGQPLSSGGMIYINAKGGQNVTIKQAIKIVIPTNNLADSMRLYKGEKKEDGNINWTSPTALPENKQLIAIDNGKRLFESKCANCHAIGKDMTGPDLAHILKRFNKILEDEGGGRYFDHGYQNHLYEGYSGIYKTIKDTLGKEKRIYGDEVLYHHSDPFPIYKCNLMKRFGGLLGPKFFNTDTSTTEFSLYRYIQNESDRKSLPLPAQANLFNCADSCVLYSQTIIRLENQKIEVEEKRKNLVDQSPASTEEIKVKTGSSPEPPVDFENLVSPSNNKGVYYQFTIETFGWYNIDVLLSGMIGNIESELQIRITGSYKEKLDIFLIIPEEKIYVKAGKKAEGTDEYVFAFKDGKIFLPQNAKAFILALTESESSIAFNLFDFTTRQSQQIEMELKSSTKEAFNNTLSKLKSNDLKIAVKDAENADSIRKTDADLKTINEELKKADNLKPKNCDCNCGPEKDPVAKRDSIKNVTPK